MSDTSAVVLGMAEHSGSTRTVTGALECVSGLGMVAHARSEAEPPAAGRPLEPATLVLDADVPLAELLGALERITALVPGVAVVALVAEHLGAEDVSTAAASRTVSVVSLSDADELTREAVFAVTTQARQAPTKGSGLGEGDSARTTGGRLSAREIEVLELASAGRRTKQIAAELGIATDTVETLFRRAARKLGASTRTHAVAEAIRCGFL